jgi:ribonuclease J
MRWIHGDPGSPLDESTSAELPPIPAVSLPGKAPDGILLSHAHPDYSGLLHRTPSSVPVWMTRGTSKMLLASEVFCRQTAQPRKRFVPLGCG